MGRLLRLLATGLVGAAVFGAGWWAGNEALRSPDDPLADPEPLTYQVDAGTVGRSLRAAAVAERRFEDLARNARSGVVTSVTVDQGAAVAAGDVVYTVDLRPVVVAEGTVPAFRDLARGVRGEDVTQLQGLLAELGFYDGELDGRFGAGLRRAVLDWQESLGLTEDGVVRRGDVVFVPELPTNVTLAAEIEVGNPLAGGELAMRRVLGDVDFWISTTPEQRSQIPLMAPVLVIRDDGAWEARIADVAEDVATGELRLVLEAPEGGPVCGSDCDPVSLEGQSTFPAEIVVVPSVSGPVVPVAAIETLPDGSTVVTASDGAQVPIGVVASSGGMAVVEGIGAGDVIVLPIEEAAP